MVIVRWITQRQSERLEPFQDGPQIEAQKSCDRSQQQAQVPTGRAQDRMHRVAGGTLEPVTVHQPIDLNVPNQRLDHAPRRRSRVRRQRRSRGVPLRCPRQHAPGPRPGLMGPIALVRHRSLDVGPLCSRIVLGCDCRGPWLHRETCKVLRVKRSKSCSSDPPNLAIL
jgi:hypothetical protein